LLPLCIYGDFPLFFLLRGLGSCGFGMDGYEDMVLEAVIDRRYLDFWGLRFSGLDFCFAAARALGLPCEDTLRNKNQDGVMAQWQRIGFRYRRLQVRVLLTSFFAGFLNPMLPPGMINGRA
jgi:hypothetical protein